MPTFRSALPPAKILACATLVALAVPAEPALAKTLDARKIVDKMIEADPMGYGGAEAEVIMVLVNKRGQQRSRKMISLSRNDAGTRRTFVRFTDPTDIAGTAFLGISKGEERTQHLYMPALAKTNRISASRRNSRFVGSDYTYADMDYRDIENAEVKKLADEKVGNQDCYVIEARPRSRDSEYGKVTMWISKQSFLPVRIRYYGKGKAGDEIKRLTVQAIKRESGRYIITESRMVDLKRDHTTVLKAVKVRLRDDVPLEQFTVRSLDRQ